MEKTIALTGAEIKVEYGGGANAWLRNDGTSTVYAARTAGIVEGADGVTSIPAGQSAPVYGANGAVYLLGAGSVQLIGSDYSTNPFDGVSMGGAADIVSDAAGMVTLDGLQGGVPFSDITISGKNLITYPYKSASQTINGITFTDNGDGTVTADGTATAAADFSIGANLRLGRGKYVLSGCPAGGSNPGYKLQAYGDTMYNSGAGIMDIGNSAPFVALENFNVTRIQIRFAAGSTADGLVFKPQLEAGEAATEYSRPITGQEITLTVNGAEYPVTPDSNPYTVPVDILQQDGRNSISVSAGKFIATGVRRSAALKRVWDKLDGQSASAAEESDETV